MSITINGTTGIAGVDGTAAAPSVQGADSNTGVFFPAADTVAITTGGLERMRIDASGNVGIGTSAPTAKLDFRGYCLLGTYGGTYQGVTLRNNDDSSVADTTSFIDTQNNLATTDTSIFFVHQTSGGSLMTFATTPAGSRSSDRRVERMRIDGSGVLCVNGQSASGSISVKERGFAPTVNMTGAALSLYGAYGGAISFFDSATASGNGYSIWVDDSANDFNIAKGSSTSGITGGVYINNNAGSWTSRSDERDKKNLKPIQNAIAKVTRLRAVIGEYIWAEGVRHPFLLAQDVQAVLPEAVSVANKSAPVEDQRLGVSYTDTIPLLVAAIQEQQAIITALTARIAALEAK